jgi:hypothetical protein
VQKTNVKSGPKTDYKQESRLVSNVNFEQQEKPSEISACTRFLVRPVFENVGN